MSDHETLHQVAEAYALGLASEMEARQFEDHLTTCAECRQTLAELVAVHEGLGRLAPPAAPPARLRERVLTVAAGRGAQRPPSAAWWLAAAAALVAAVCGTQWWATSARLTEAEAELASVRSRLADAESRRAAAERTSADTAGRLAIALAPDAIAVPLTGQAAAPAASGRVVWSASRGVVFSAASLPALPDGRVYQLWAVTAPAPVGLALLEPAPSGSVDVVAPAPAGVTPAAFAVTIEPTGGSPGPTGAMYLLGSR
jgi:anti-sigma-K factor RskA